MIPPFDGRPEDGKVFAAKIYLYRRIATWLPGQNHFIIHTNEGIVHGDYSSASAGDADEARFLTVCSEFRHRCATRNSYQILFFKKNSRNDLADYLHNPAEGKIVMYGLPRHPTWDQLGKESQNDKNGSLNTLVPQPFREFSFISPERDDCESKPDFPFGASSLPEYLDNSLAGRSGIVPNKVCYDQDLDVVSSYHWGHGDNEQGFELFGYAEASVTDDFLDGIYEWVLDHGGKEFTERQTRPRRKR
jgi:hypothetical protein